MHFLEQSNTVFTFFSFSITRRTGILSLSAHSGKGRKYQIWKYRNPRILVTFWCRCCCCCSCCRWWRCCGCWRGDSGAFAATVFPIRHFATGHVFAILVHKSRAPRVLVAVNGGATHVFDPHERKREDTVATGAVASARCDPSLCGRCWF